MGTGRSTNAVAPGTVPAARVDGPGTDEDGGRRSSGPPCDRPTLVTVRSTNACSESAGLGLAPQPHRSGRHDKQPSNGVARPQQPDHDDHDRRRIQKSQDDHAERILRRTHRSQGCARRAAEAPSRPLATDAEEQSRGIVGQCSSEADAAGRRQLAEAAAKDKDESHSPHLAPRSLSARGAVPPASYRPSRKGASRANGAVGGG